MRILRFISASLLALTIMGACTDKKSAATDQPAADSDKFVTVVDGQFMLGDSVYRYVGTNFWYGAILASEGRGGNRERLDAELDTLQALGIDNLRILVGGDGATPRASQIAPTLQTAPGVYNDTLLRGLDYLLADLERRGMRAVLYLNNAWEWSGGYGTYLEWAGYGPCPIPSETSYQQYMEFVKNFVLCDSAKQMAMDHVRNIVGRTNSVTGRPYAESPAIMSWQIANEPRAFSQEGKEPLRQWIDSTAVLIKQIDPNHLVSTGNEGLMGCEFDLDLWDRIHSSPAIDYANIHIWPYNWGWLREGDSKSDPLTNAKQRTRDYIALHDSIMTGHRKPLVVEEFGYPRDGMAVAPGSPTQGRDEYYRFLFDLIAESGLVQGANFWGWGGLAVPAHESWVEGDDYTGDPAQEAQGLNSVFAADTSTVAIIRAATEKLRQNATK